MLRVGQWVEQWSTDARGTALSTGAVAFAVQQAVAARSLPLPKVTIIGESGVIGVLLRQHPSGYLTVAIGSGAVRGEMTLLLPVSDERARFVFDSAEVHGDWEPFYRLFADIALRLGARADFVRRPAFDEAALAERLKTSLDACASDCLFAEGLATYNVELTARASGDIEEMSLRVGRGEDTVDIDLIAPGLVVRASLGGDSALLSDPGLDVLESALRGDWNEPIRDAIRAYRRVSAPPVDLERKGAVVAFIRAEDGRRSVVDDDDASDPADLLARYLPTHDVEIVRFFQDGTPFWKASFARGSTAPDLPLDGDLDAFYAHRVWQWDPDPPAPSTR